MELERNEHMQPFENEGVTFIFPDNLGHLKAVPIGYPKKWPDKGIEIFKPLGYVMNFKIVSIDPKKPVNEDDTCIMEVKYKQKHQDSATQQSYETPQLGLAYETDPWENRTDMGDITLYEDSRSEWVGIIVIPLAELSRDPVVAWGP